MISAYKKNIKHMFHMDMHHVEMYVAFSLLGYWNLSVFANGGVALFFLGKLAAIYGIAAVLLDNLKHRMRAQFFLSVLFLENIVQAIRYTLDYQWERLFVFFPLFALLSTFFAVRNAKKIVYDKARRALWPAAAKEKHKQHLEYIKNKGPFFRMKRNFRVGLTYMDAEPMEMVNAIVGIIGTLVFISSWQASTITWFPHIYIVTCLVTIKGVLDNDLQIRYYAHLIGVMHALASVWLIILNPEVSLFEEYYMSSFYNAIMLTWLSWKCKRELTHRCHGRNHGTIN